jgi:chemosensory pili system protein ChpA (sensor histidine kinase/response regulator)
MAAAAKFGDDASAPAEAATARQGRGEVARVDADLLEELLNNAGEVSIFRSRLDQQVKSVEFNLAELAQTVSRLKDQLRKLEIETEAQIIHRHQEEIEGGGDFDPLELDRYSLIQQLSRALAETASDVDSIRSLMHGQIRDADALLVQQGRVTTAIQHGLMRTRKVPFERHGARLSRVVRQVAAEVGKRAELELHGSGELDRQVLERMLSPLEHMLRNAVVHGIEFPQQRRAAGKPETGKITVNVRREGAEVLVEIGDDGSGLDIAAIRENAVARGLVGAGKIRSDQHAIQLIFEPGFSTASELTQAAGRGVGMEVVANEVRRLGGSISVTTEQGKGTSFLVRLPFTLAIAQAMIVRVNDEYYALPLTSVEGIARIPREELLRKLEEQDPSYEYGGQDYRFQYLAQYVGAEITALSEDTPSVPVVLVRAGEYSTALIGDELLGSREVVVKSVGPQLATIDGIAGATIMGDGRIAIILDAPTLLRTAVQPAATASAAEVEDRRTFVLVVDDSITVRRVTQRLLERNGMRVATAKDGVDALAILQEHLPDVILLDIEMPRMDGYELAGNIRNDRRLQNIPIIMITSRVGSKHRARAIELGVDDYLGKPYQEAQLLDAIEPLVNEGRTGNERIR